MSVIAKDLMEDALERHEGLLLSEMAMKREAALVTSGYPTDPAFHYSKISHHCEL